MANDLIELTERFKAWLHFLIKVQDMIAPTQRFSIQVPYVHKVQHSRETQNFFLMQKTPSKSANLLQCGSLLTLVFRMYSRKGLFRLLVGEQTD